MSSNRNDIVVLNKKIPTKVEEISITELKFWADNPRVNSTVKKQFGNSKVTDIDIENILKEEEHVKELFQDIKKHGGLIDEILVKDNVVLEGNSRLCAYRMLLEKASKLNDEEDMLKWSYIRCKVIPSNTTDEEIFTILGTWHIKGKKQWDTFEKAAYLKRMRDDHNYSSKKISDMVGESESLVEHSIEAHDLMVKHEVYDLDKYSYFIEMVKNRGINDHAKKDKQIQEKIIKAIKNDQFNRAEEIRDVHKVLKDKVAKRTLFEEQANFADALEVTLDRNPEFDDTFYSHLKKTTNKLSKIEAKKIDKIKSEIESDSNKKDILRRFFKEVKKFSKQTGTAE